MRRVSTGLGPAPRRRTRPGGSGSAWSNSRRHPAIVLRSRPVMRRRDDPPGPYSRARRPATKPPAPLVGTSDDRHQVEAAPLAERDAIAAPVVTNPGHQGAHQEKTPSARLVQVLRCEWIGNPLGVETVPSVFHDDEDPSPVHMVADQDLAARVRRGHA